MSRESLKNTLSLLVITVIAGLLLGLVYEVTKDPIAKQKQKAKEAAYKEVFEDAKGFEAEELQADTGDKLKEQGYAADIDELMRVSDAAGGFAGYVLTVTDHEGYGGDIQFAMGIKKDGTLCGISFLSIGETAGLGMKALESKFKDQFKGKKAERLVYTKNGASGEDEVDAISGATITTNAVTNGVNAGIYYCRSLAKEVTGR